MKRTRKLAQARKKPVQGTHPKPEKKKRASQMRHQQDLDPRGYRKQAPPPLFGYEIVGEYPYYRYVEKSGHVKPRPKLKPPPGYRVNEHNRFVFEPVGLTGQQYLRQLQDDLCDRVQRGDPPSPKEYAVWYRDICSAERKVLFESVRQCIACGKLLRATKKRGKLVRDNKGDLVIDDPGGLRAAAKLWYCSERCRQSGKVKRWRDQHPEHKLRR